MMLGSVSRCIATSSPCPAVVARGEPLPVRGEIVIGVREPERAAAALRFGFEEASLRQCRLLAVHAWGSPGLLEDTVQRGIDPVAASARADLVVLGRHRVPGSDAPAIGSALHASWVTRPGRSRSSQTANNTLGS